MDSPDGNAARGAHSSRESEERFRALIGSIDEIVFEFDADGRFLNIWTTNEALLLRPREELLGHTISELTSEEFFTPFRQIFRRVLETGHGENIEYPLHVRMGRRWFLSRVNRIPSSDGAVHTVCVLARDITDRRHGEETLRLSEEKFANAFLGSPDAIVICTLADGHLTEINENFLRLTGHTRRESLGRSFQELRLWTKPQEGEDFLATVHHDSEVHDREAQFRIKSGELRSVRISAHALDLNSEPAFIAILRDVTEQRALEEQLRQAQRMEPVGRLAGGVAHDFNNLLVGILGYSELLKRKIGAASPLHRMAEEINAAAVRARDLTSRLLALSRHQLL